MSTVVEKNTFSVLKKSDDLNNNIILNKINEINEKEKLGKIKFVSFEEGYYNGIEHLKKIFSNSN